MIRAKWVVFPNELKAGAAVAVICHRGLAACPKTAFTFQNASAHARPAIAADCVLSAIKTPKTPDGTRPAYGVVDADQGNRELDASASTERRERCCSAPFF
jgi:hypothetical protein